MRDTLWVPVGLMHEEICGWVQMLKRLVGGGSIYGGDLWMDLKYEQTCGWDPGT